MDFEELFKELKKNLFALIKNKFFEFKSEGEKDMKAFLATSKAKLKRWTGLLKSGDIDLEDFEWLVKSQKDLLVMNGLYQTGLSRIKLGHFKNKVLKTIVETVKVVL
jgi:hypothetical protein